MTYLPMYGTSTVPPEEIAKMESFQTKLCAKWSPWIYKTIKSSDLIDMSKYEGMGQDCSDEDMPYLVIEYAYEKGLEPDEDKIIASFMSDNNLTYVLSNVFPEYFLFSPSVSYKASSVSRLIHPMTKKQAMVIGAVSTIAIGGIIFAIMQMKGDK
jgi:hypothetical protein